MKKKKRILIVRPDRIGDVVLSTPIPREIKKNYPDSFIAVMVRRYTRDIYLNNPYVDRILIIDDLPEEGWKSFWTKCRELRKFKFSHSLLLLPTARINYLLFCAGIKFRVGVGHRLFQTITFTRSVHRNKYIPLRHEADYCMDLARKIGVMSNNIDTEIHLTEEEKGKVKGIRTELLGDKKYLVGIHSTSGKSAPNWKPETYKDLILELGKNPDVQIVVTDNIIPDELKNIEGVLYPNIGLILRESILIFSSIDLLLSASTGPMHLCGALKVKTVSLFCPLTACSPGLWKPQGNNSKELLPEENYCATQCPKDPKKCDYTGSILISPRKIVEEINNFVSI